MHPALAERSTPAIQATQQTYGRAAAMMTYRQHKATIQDWTRVIGWRWRADRALAATSHDNGNLVVKNVTVRSKYIVAMVNPNAVARTVVATTSRFQFDSGRGDMLHTENSEKRD
jgi:hypothetical protein